MKKGGCIDSTTLTRQLEDRFAIVGERVRKGTGFIERVCQIGGWRDGEVVRILRHQRLTMDVEATLDAMQELRLGPMGVVRPEK